MGRLRSALAAAVALAVTETAASAPAQAAEPFPVIEVEVTERRSHRLAWVALAGGAGLIAGSLALGERADRSYDAYHAATDPAEVERLWRRTVHYDRLSSGAMISGQALVVTAVWLRFLRDPEDARYAVVVGPASCAVSLRF